MKRLLQLVPAFLFVLASVSVASAADWSLDGATSRLSFVSVKAGTIAEAHHFTRLEGEIDADGKARVRIPLDSVETLIDIRNERMREFLFETNRFPDATVTAEVDLDQFDGLDLGERERLMIEATLDLHGLSRTLEAEVFVTRIGPDRVAVDTVDPIVIDADLFGLGQGIQKLMQLAGLEVIAPTVPVTFSFVFAR